MKNHKNPQYRNRYSPSHYGFNVLLLAIAREKKTTALFHRSGHQQQSYGLMPTDTGGCMMVRAHHKNKKEITKEILTFTHFISS